VSVACSPLSGTRLRLADGHADRRPDGDLGDEAAMEAIVAGFDATYERQFGKGTG
jgi:hypothetical protein